MINSATVYNLSQINGTIYFTYEEPEYNHVANSVQQDGKHVWDEFSVEQRRNLDMLESNE